jgi:large subunit ribosomal protein L15
LPHNKRKVRKQRGSRTYGYGRVGQHRGSGKRGGTGKTGRRKHKWTYILKYEPNYFEKKGFKSTRKKLMKTINVGELDEQVMQLPKQKKAFRKHGKIHVNLEKMGFNKLLGSGQVTHPLVVSVQTFSKSSINKIQDAGGRILQVETKGEY